MFTLIRRTAPKAQSTWKQMMTLSTSSSSSSAIISKQLLGLRQYTSETKSNEEQQQQQQQQQQPQTTATTTEEQTEIPHFEVISTDLAPKAVGPYSQAIKVNRTLYVSGCLGINPKSASLEESVEGQARQALSNLRHILEAGDSSLSRVVKTTLLLQDINDYPKVNEIYSDYFVGAKPARTCYAVSGLPKGAKVEIDAIAITTK